MSTKSIVNPIPVVTLRDVLVITYATLVEVPASFFVTLVRRWWERCDIDLGTDLIRSGIRA